MPSQTQCTRSTLPSSEPTEPATRRQAVLAGPFAVEEVARPHSRPGYAVVRPGEPLPTSWGRPARKGHLTDQQGPSTLWMSRTYDIPTEEVDMTSTTTPTDEPVKSAWRWLPSCGGALTETDRRNSNRFALWTLAWAVSFIAASSALKHLPGLPSAAAWAIAAAPSLLGVTAILAYLRFLRQADELQRRIQLEGLAFGFGVGAVFAIGYQLFELAGAPRFSLTDGALVMFLSWTLGQFLAQRRYR